MTKQEPINWRSRIVGHGRAAADQFLFHPENPKFHPENQRAALAGAINEVGQVAPVIVNVRTGYLVDGHERIWLALQDNAEVDYIEIDVDEAEERYILATLDPIGHMARHDRDKLDDLLRVVQSGEAGVQAMLSDLAEANGLLEGWNNAEPPEDFNEYGEDIETEYCCPKCGYKWSGKPN